MSASSGNRVGIVIAVLLAAVIAGVIAWNWRGSNDANFPAGTFWICSSQTCRHEFGLTMAELSDHHAQHYGEPVPCPKCKQPAQRADRCPHCGKVYLMQRNSVTCPACGKSGTEPPAK